MQDAKWLVSAKVALQNFNRLSQIASSFKPSGKCLKFLNKLLENGGSGTVDINTLISEIKDMAGKASSSVYDGPSATNVDLTTEAFGNSNEDGATTVARVAA